jgi:hypothetical protein
MDAVNDVKEAAARIPVPAAAGDDGLMIRLATVAHANFPPAAPSSSARWPALVRGERVR